MGIELLLASDIVLMADNTRLAQIEIKRGIFPFGGASQRWVAATLRSARLAVEQGQQAAFRALVPEIRTLMASEDAREGAMAFMQRRPAQFQGR